MRREERVTVQNPVKKQQPDGMSHRGGLRSAIFRNFSQLLFAYPPRVRVGALCVSCAEVLLLEASAGVVTAPQFSRNFPQFFQFNLTLHDRNLPRPCPRASGAD